MRVCMFIPDQGRQLHDNWSQCSFYLLMGIGILLVLKINFIASSSTSSWKTNQGLTPSKTAQYAGLLDSCDCQLDRAMPHRIGTVAWRRHCAPRPRHRAATLGTGWWSRWRGPDLPTIFKKIDKNFFNNVNLENFDNLIRIGLTHAPWFILVHLFQHGQQLGLVLLGLEADFGQRNNAWHAQ